MPLQATSGAASYDAFGGGVALVPTFVEDVFQTHLYQADGSSTQTINNGIDLSGKGGLVWIKSRSNATGNVLVDTVRGSPNVIQSNTTNAQASWTNEFGSFSSTGFTVPYNTIYGETNFQTRTYTSWTFRKQPKFFDVVTWTGNSTAGRQIPHSLGSAPGFVVVKRTSNTNNWICWHRALTSTQYIQINSTSEAFSDGGIFWNSTIPDATNLTLGNDSGVNGSGSTYVAYLFAHDAGGFGLTGTDNVISCGSFTSAGPSTDVTVTLGYEPQWILQKNASVSADWEMYDVMRGMSNTNTAILKANKSDAETNATVAYFPRPTATGFIAKNSLGADSGNTIIYIAIRRGPMKVPTVGTSVFTPQIATVSGSASNTVTTNFPVDLTITQVRNGYFAEWLDRLRGDSQSTYVRLRSANTSVEATGAFGLGFDNNTGYVDNYNWQNFGGGPFVYWNFRRAPSFFDVVCYTGTGAAMTVSHNLAEVPELIIVKSRSNTANGVVYSSSSGTGFYLRLFSTSSDSGNTSTAGAFWNNTTPTSSVFSIGTSNQVNGSGVNYVAYLFATCAGVSKVGSYTGTGATQTINCGFTGGARFVLIKKTTSTAPDRDWFVWDTARGMVSGTDPSLKLNTTAAEVNADDIYTITTGFQIVSSADYVNASGVTYIFLAIA